MHSQVKKSSKTVDLGNAPHWFADLWMNSKSRFMDDIDLDDPPPWLIHLHETVQDLNVIPEHLLLEYSPGDEELIEEQAANEDRKTNNRQAHPDAAYEPRECAEPDFTIAGLLTTTAVT